MGLETVRASLVSAVAVLFTDSRAAPIDEGDPCATCGGSFTPPTAPWCALREFPVCVRSVVVEWRQLAALRAPHDQKNTKKRKNNGASTTSSGAVRAASMARLCAELYQCGLLAGSRDDSEVVALIVSAIDDDDDATSDRQGLCRVLQQRALARCVRLRVFQYALLATTPSTHSWVGEVALAFQEELKQASIELVTRTGASARKSKKRGRGSIGMATVGTDVCAACHEQDARENTSRRGTQLVDALGKWLQAGQAEATVVEAVEGLIGVLHAPEVVQLLQRTDAAAAPIAGRPRRDGCARPIRSVPSVKVKWDDSDRITEAVCGASKIPLWRLVWRRERSRMFGMATAFGTLDEVVALCEVADRFAHSTPTDSNAVGRTDVSIGFRVIRAVTNHAIKSSNPLVTILRAIAAARDRKAVASTTLVSKASLHQRHSLYVAYARALLDDDDEVQDDPTKHAAESQTPTRRLKGPAKQDATTSDLLECVELVHKIIVGVPNDLEHLSESKRHDLFALWFQLIAKIARDVSDNHGSVGAHWSSFLDAIAQCCEEVKVTTYDCAHPFAAFVGDVLVGIIVSDGARITSPAGCETESIAIPVDANEQSTIQVLLGLILAASGEPRIVAATIYRLVVVVTRQEQARIQSGKSRQRYGVAFPRLLFPLLDAHFSNAEGATETSLSQVVEIVQLHVQKQHDCHKLARGLVALLLEWDSYSERHNREIVTAGCHQGDLKRSDRKGLQAACEHGVWQDLVRFYASDKTDCVAHETPTFLRHVSELLRSIDPERCPSELEGSLFSVLARISGALSQSQAQRDPRPISHSDETILRFIQAFESSADVGNGRDLVEALKRDDKLEDLVLNLRRWLGILTANPRALPNEAAATLVMLANRLVFWCGPELSAVEVLLVPVDGALLSALQLYSASSPSLTSQISVVRLSVMTRAYVSINPPPNLVELTAAIVDAALSCSSPAARDGLLKLMQGFAAFLVVEVLSDRLRSAILQVGDRASAKTVRNALVILTSAPRILRSRVVGFSLDVYSVPTAEKWLSAVLLMGLASESSAKSFGKSVDALLVCLEALLGLNERDQDAAGDQSPPSVLFQHAYALDALLSTAVRSLPRDEKTSSIRARIQTISHQLQCHLSGNAPADAGSCSIGTKQSLLMIHPINGDSQQQRKGKRSIDTMCTSSIVFVDRRRTVECGVSPVTGDVLRPVTFDSTEADAAHDGIATRWHLTFSSWMASALLAQQQALGDFANVDVYAAWEFVFSEIVLQFYLPVQFDGNADLLTVEWLSSWIQQCLALSHCIDLLPFQRSMLLEHLATRNPWIHLTWCTKVLVADDIPPAAGTAILHHVVRSLDLVVLSSVRGFNAKDIDAMASDVTSMLEKLSQPNEPDVSDSATQRLATVAPLIETFVRASLRSATLDPQRVSVIECAKRVGIFVQQLLARSETCARWWSETLATWKRPLSHLNRRDAAHIIAALEFQVCDLTASDDDDHAGSATQKR